jgi:WD40 repeat protein
VITKGFFCLIGGKRLCLYTKIGDTWDFAKTREYIVPAYELGTARSTNSMTTGSDSSIDKVQLPSSLSQMMWKVIVSEAEEHILILSSKQQIYAVSDMAKDQAIESRVMRCSSLFNENHSTMTNIKLIVVHVRCLSIQDAFQLELVFQCHHQSAIRGIDIAIQKPLFVSTGDDHTVRLWNYETINTEQIKAFNEPVYAISLHPTGHQMVVALASKVCLMNILIDGFETLREYPIHASHGVRFR